MIFRRDIIIDTFCFTVNSVLQQPVSSRTRAFCSIGFHWFAEVHTGSVVHITPSCYSWGEKKSLFIQTHPLSTYIQWHVDAILCTCCFVWILFAQNEGYLFCPTSFTLKKIEKISFDVHHRQKKSLTQAQLVLMSTSHTYCKTDFILWTYPLRTPSTLSNTSVT